MVPSRAAYEVSFCHAAQLFKIILTWMTLSKKLVKCSQADQLGAVVLCGAFAV